MEPFPHRRDADILGYVDGLGSEDDLLNAVVCVLVMWRRTGAGELLEET